MVYTEYDKIRERDVEARFKYASKKIGALTFKVTSVGVHGLPDRVLMYKGHTFWIELKRPVGGVLSAAQKTMISRFQSMGIPYFVLCDYTEVDVFMRYVVVVCQ